MLAAMNPEIFSHSEQMSPRAGQILLLSGDDATARALYSIARLAAENRAIYVLDGANKFDAYWIARLARGWGSAPEIALARVRLSRAFTCYQMRELIARKLNPPASSAIFCLRLLDTFYDEDVPLADAVRLLRQSLARLRALARAGAIVVMTARAPAARARVVLWNVVRQAAME